MRFAEIWLVVGTRPEAIKLSPVARALRARGRTPLLVLTGQHPGLRASDFALDDFDCLDLGCPGELNPYSHARRVEERMRAKLRKAAPSLLVVQGDTSSAFGAAQAAFALGVPVAHVEAGLRTNDPRSPWPEEEFRTAIDARAMLLFAPTDVSAANLRRERIAGQVHITGNSGIDALLETLAELPPERLHDRALPTLLVTSHRRESWGGGMEAIARALGEIAAAGTVMIDIVLHPNPAVAELLSRRLGGTPNVTLLPPLSHADLIQRMRDSDLILSDSGGIQEEAPALGVPLLVLREKTERPEAVTSGNARLVGVDTKRIVAEVRGLLDQPAALAAMARRAFPFGDGGSGERIAGIVDQWLARPSMALR